MLRDPQKTIGNMIDKQAVAYIGAIDAEGYPNIKCMLRPRKREGIGVIWFSTNTSSDKVAHYRLNPKACVYICDRRFFRGALLVGDMEVLEDPQYKEMLWERGDTLYYPEGVTDPDYCVLRFTAKKLRYYSDFKSQEVDLR